jgi:hypothetical protein
MNRKQHLLASTKMSFTIIVGSDVVTLSRLCAMLLAVIVELSSLVYSDETYLRPYLFRCAAQGF